MKRNGIVNPIWTLRAARENGIPIDLACAVLDQESGGGHNVWGHDQTIFIGGIDGNNKEVNKRDYIEYRKQRGPTGRGGMQGVGPMQLTYYNLQDMADRIGGCWKPYCNMRVGFMYLAGKIQQYGMLQGIAAYNGNGVAAARYAKNVTERRNVWRARLGIK